MTPTDVADDAALAPTDAPIEPEPSVGEGRAAEASPFDEEMQAARAELSVAMERFARRVNPNTDFGSGWLAYLEWEALGQQVQAGGPIASAVLTETLGRLNSGAEGLEISEARAVAAAIARVVGLNSLSRAQDPAAFIAKQGAAASALATKPELDPRIDVFAIEQRLALLGVTDFGLDATAAIRARFSQPNTLVAVQTSLLNRMLASPGAECVDVSDCILGTRIKGNGLTRSSLRVSTLQAGDRARLRFSLSGKTNSRTRGVNGPVAIRSLGATTFNASKVVELSADAFRMQHAAATASTRSTTQSVSKIGGGIGSRIIERIAKGRVAEQRGQADAIAGRRAGGRVAARFDERLNERLIDARRRYDDQLIAPLKRRGAEPRSIAFATTPSSLVVATTQANHVQLAADTPPPAMLDGELVVSVHESAVANVLAAYLGGATLRRDEPDGPPIYQGGVTPAWLEKMGDRERPTLAEFKPWAITFRSARPISVGFRAGRVRLAIHAAVLATDEKSYEGWDLISTYEPVRAGEGWALERQGDVEVLPTGFDPASGKRLPSQKGALRRNLQAAMNDAEGRMPSRVPLDDVVLDRPAGAVRSLAVDEIVVADGWLQTAWRAL
ncbi:MAG: hypothetical protein AAFV43_05330 [Planctomycetota bacterium]